MFVGMPGRRRPAARSTRRMALAQFGSGLALQRSLQTEAPPAAPSFAASSFNRASETAWYRCFSSASRSINRPLCWKNRAYCSARFSAAGSSKDSSYSTATCSTPFLCADAHRAKRRAKSDHESNCGFCQAQFWSLAFQAVWVFTMAFRIVRNLRIAAVIATFWGFPRASNR